MASACAIWVYSLGDSARGCIPQAERPLRNLMFLSERNSSVGLIRWPTRIPLVKFRTAAVSVEPQNPHVVVGRFDLSRCRVEENCAPVRHDGLAINRHRLVVCVKHFADKSITFAHPLIDDFVASGSASLERVMPHRIDAP